MDNSIRTWVAGKYKYSVPGTLWLGILLTALLLIASLERGALAGMWADERPREITGAAEPIRSPDGRLELFWRRDDERGIHVIWLRTVESPTQTKQMYTFERSASVLWSPNGEMVAITDRLSSNQSRVKVFRVSVDGDPSEMTTVAEYLESFFVDHKGKRIFGHSYAKAMRWSQDSKNLQVELSAYDALDQRPPLQRLVAVSITSRKKDQRSRPSRPEACVGGFCLDNSLLDEARLVERYGAGFISGILKSKGRYLQKTHCYYASEQDVWVEFTADYHDQTEKIKEIVRIFLSKEHLCKKNYTPNKPFAEFVTPQGIQVGSLENDVIRAYGKPTRVDDSVQREKRDPRYKSSDLASKYGPTVLVYLAGKESLLHASFYIKDPRVHSILISVSE